jgi:drug/metabolite transporter (DMT)-like permease
MRIVIWVFQILLAIAFLAHGLMMLFPPASIAEQMNASLPRWFSLFIGVAEVLAFIGLTVPPLARRHRWLMAWAAGGIMIVMISATIFHAYRNEISSAVTTLVLLVLATLVANVRRREHPLGTS